MLIFEIIIVQTVIFFIVFLVLRRLMVQNTESAVNRLKSTDGENLKRLEEMKRKIGEAEAAYRQKSVELAQELEREREAGRKQMEEEKTRLLGEARGEGDRILSSAKDRSTRISDEIEKKFHARVSVLAGEVVRNVLSLRMKATVNEQLIDELLQEFETLEIGQIPEQTTEASVLLPHPLSPDCRKKIGELLGKKIGRKIEIREAVKKEMAGGMILTLGSLVMDGSLENKIDGLLRGLKK